MRDYHLARKDYRKLQIILSPVIDGGHFMETTRAMATAKHSNTSPTNEMQDEHDECGDQDDVDQATSEVKSKCTAPEDQKDDGDGTRFF